FTLSALVNAARSFASSSDDSGGIDGAMFRAIEAICEHVENLGSRKGALATNGGHRDETVTSAPAREADELLERAKAVVSNEVFTSECQALYRAWALRMLMTAATAKEDSGQRVTQSPELIALRNALMTAGLLQRAAHGRLKVAGSVAFNAFVN